MNTSVKTNTHITSTITELLESLGPASHRGNHQHPASLLLKKAKSSRGEVQTVLTPYGYGKLLEVSISFSESRRCYLRAVYTDQIVPAVPELDMKSRAKVLLD